jgi:cytochrome c oxidase assembly protein Cox11
MHVQDVPSSMQWKFKPLQDEIYVHPGETALAFFTGYLLLESFNFLKIPKR